jgi:Tfp pilus assembly protein PilO
VNHDALDELLRDVRPETAIAGLCVLALLIALAGHLYVLRPPLAKLEELQREGSEGTLQSTLQAVAAGRAQITETQQTLDSLRTELYGGSSRMPPEKLESYIVDRLDHISASHEVELVSVAPGEAEEVLMFDEVPYDVEVQGDYFALFAWLREVERELRPMVVKEFNMKPLSKSEDVVMKLRLASYRQRKASS